MNAIQLLARFGLTKPPAGGGGGGVEFIDFTTNNGGTGVTTTSINVPEGAQAGDILVSAVFVSSSDGGGDPPSDMDGWTHIHTAVLNFFSRRTYMAYIVLDGSPPASFQWSGHGASANKFVATACFRGQNATSPIADDDWNTEQGTPELTAVAGCTALAVMRQIDSSINEVPPEMTPLREDVEVVGYESGISEGAYSRTFPGNNDPVSTSVVLIQP